MRQDLQRALIHPLTGRPMIQSRPRKVSVTLPCPRISMKILCGSPRSEPEKSPRSPTAPCKPPQGRRIPRRSAPCRAGRRQTEPYNLCCGQQGPGHPIGGSRLQTPSCTRRSRVGRSALLEGQRSGHRTTVDTHLAQPTRHVGARTRSSNGVSAEHSARRHSDAQQNMLTQ
jgi:hypothetical protein